MAPYSKLVTGTDGSDAATDAIAVTGVIASTTGIPVAVVTAWKSSVAVPGAREQSWADLTAQGADVDLTALGVKNVELHPLQGNAFDSLVAVANQNDKALIVVGAAGLDQASSRLLGSTSNQLSHNSPVDVLFVRRAVERFDTVALATDGSATSMRAVRSGLEFARSVGAQPTLVTAATDTASGTAMLTDVADQLAVSGVAQKILTGNPADALVADSGNYDLLVIGNRGMSGLPRVLGSTANTITHRAASNLLLVNTASTGD